MDKFGAFKPDEQTIESWLDEFEARLLCHNINTCDQKKRWCLALIGEAGRNILKRLPVRATWDQVKHELCEVLGEAHPKDRAFDTLLSYKPGDKGLGEMASDIMTKASRATDDEEIQRKLGLKAFLKAVPETIRKDLSRKHFRSVKEALEEARFLQRVEEEESLSSKGKVLTAAPQPQLSQQEMIEECIRQLGAKGLLNEKRERPRSQASCWGCGDEGHFVMQCPFNRKSRSNLQGAGRGRMTGNE